MDTFALIQSFATNPATGSYVVTRRAKAGDDGRGRARPGPTSTFPIMASIQPASGRDLLRLPEGRRSIETRVVYTATQLFIGAQNAAFESDLIAFEGNTWEVQQVATWDQAPAAYAGYYRVIVQATA